MKHFTMKPKCKYCDNDCIEDGGPVTVMQFTIPWTKIEIIVWNWGKVHYLDMCDECMTETDPFNNACESAYNQGLEDGAREYHEGNILL